MTELASGGALEAAAWKVKNLDDYDARLERAARRVDELARAHRTAALVIYEAALMKSGRPFGEVRRLVREFEETFKDAEEELIIPRASGIMNVGGVPGFDLRLMQYLRVAAGGDTLVPGEEISRALAALGVLDEGADDYAVLAAAENLALHLDLPAPIVGEILHDLAVEDRLEFSEPPPEAADEETEEVAEAEEVTEAGGEHGPGGADQGSAGSSPDERAKRRAAQE